MRASQGSLQALTHEVARLQAPCHPSLYPSEQNTDAVSM